MKRSMYLLLVLVLAAGCARTPAETPQAEIFPEECAALAVEPAIGLVGILDEALIMRIESHPARRRVEAEIGRRRVAGHAG